MNERITGKWMSKGLEDMLGKPFEIGDEVCKAFMSGRSANLQICEVTKIVTEPVTQLFLNNSHSKVHFPGRLLNLTKYRRLR